jgi:hypothetical protein
MNGWLPAEARCPDVATRVQIDFLVVDRHQARSAAFAQLQAKQGYRSLRLDRVAHVIWV